jgi:hypothetical protein
VPAEPSDDDLIQFAAEVLGELGDRLRKGSVLDETVTENRELWRALYLIAGDGGSPQERSRSLHGFLDDEQR